MNIGMGYKYGTDVVVAEAVNANVISLSQAMEIGAKAAIIRDDAAGILYGACKNGVNADGTRFIVSLINSGFITEDAAVAAGLIAATPVKFEVASMTGDNLKAVKIVFTKPVDKDSANTTNISTTEGPKVAEIQLSDDKTVAYAVLENAVAQNGKVKIKIKDVKDTDGNKIDESETELYLKDLAVPEITGVVVKDAKHIEIQASEPINYLYAVNTVLNNIKIDGSTTPIGTTKFDYVNNILKVELASALSAGTHKVEIKDMTDFSSLKAVTKEFTIAVAEDKEAPVIERVEYKSNTKLEIYFNENLSSAGKIKVNGNEISSSNISLDGNKVTVILNSSQKLNIGAVVEVKIEYKDQKDVVDNKVADWTTFTFSVADDTALPTVDVTVEDQNKLVFKFSKAMLPSEGKITVKDKDNKEVTSFNVSALTGDSKWKENNTVLEVVKADSGLNNVDVGDYTLILEDFKDASVRENSMPKTELKITAKDTKVPTVSSIFTVTEDTNDYKKDTVTFYFSEAMDADTAKNLSNYIVLSSTDGNANQSFAAISDVKVKEFASDGKSITIYYPDAEKLSQVRVLAIKDLAGNMIATSPVNKGEDDGIEVAVGEVKATDTDKVEVYFNLPIKTADPSAFKVQKKKNGEWVDFSTFKGFEIKNDESTTPESFKVIFTLVNAFDTSDTTNFRLAANADNAIENIYGSKLDKVTTPEAIVDGIAPYVKDVEAKDGKVVLITLSETVHATTTDAVFLSLVITDSDNKVINTTGGKLAAIDYLDSDGHAATVAGFSKIQLTFANDQAYKIFKISFLSRNGSIEDAQNQTIKAYAEKEITIKK
jgi:hypothetical protein